MMGHDRPCGLRRLEIATISISSKIRKFDWKCFVLLLWTSFSWVSKGKRKRKKERKKQRGVHDPRCFDEAFLCHLVPENGGETKLQSSCVVGRLHSLPESSESVSKGSVLATSPTWAGAATADKTEIATGNTHCRASGQGEIQGSAVAFSLGTPPSNTLTWFPFLPVLAPDRSLLKVLRHRARRRFDATGVRHPTPDARYWTMELTDADLCGRAKQLEFQESQKHTFNADHISALETLLLDVYAVLRPTRIDCEHRRNLVYEFDMMAKENYDSITSI
ncbi:hypothetical protein Taro_024036 [Colocasia esculenta]|uniref:Uncharacterized protein n=1 Tax=Colocasia esculenta TaxID=4460 RepID=A0A843VCI9_COLES|nr:hypothetical protein [Colocasia esculenta]